MGRGFLRKGGRGLRGARDLSTQIVHTLADMEREYFAEDGHTTLQLPAHLTVTSGDENLHSNTSISFRVFAAASFAASSGSPSNGHLMPT